jgi:hypothetical protein
MHSISRTAYKHSCHWGKKKNNTNDIYKGHKKQHMKHRHCTKEEVQPITVEHLKQLF